MSDHKFFNPDDTTHPGWNTMPDDARARFLDGAWGMIDVPTREMLAEVAREMVRERTLSADAMPAWIELEPRSVLIRIAARALTAVERMDRGAQPMEGEVAEAESAS